MITWWNSLSALEQGFAYIAIPATLILIIQTVMLLFGMGGMSGSSADMDMDTNGDGILDGSASDGGDAGLSLFTIRGFVAFFSVFGWCGLAALRGGVPTVWAVVFSFVLGALAMLVMAMFFKLAMKLQSDGTMKFANAIGVSGSVYLVIPPIRSNMGKVNVVVQGQWREFDAVTDDEEAIATGSQITVVGVSGKNVLIVARK